MGLTIIRSIVIFYREKGHVKFKTFQRDFGRALDETEFKLHGGEGWDNFVQGLLKKGIKPDSIVVLLPEGSDGKITSYTIEDDEDD
jgi:hypothetical protein